MTRFLISALGSAGDVHPFIAISQALTARGHDVLLLSSPHFGARVRSAGIAFAPLGPPGDYERLLQRPELWEPRAGARLILDELLDRLPEAYATTAALATEPGTVLVGSTLSWGVRLVQEVTGLPGATVHLSPVCIPSATAPPVLPGVGDLSWLPAWSMRLLQSAADRFLLDRAIGPRLNALRATLGLAPARAIWSRWVHASDLVVAAWPDWFAPRQSDWPPNTRTCGFPVFDEGGAGLDDPLERFLSAGAAPVGITAGSAMAHGGAFFARALDACRTLGLRTVVVTPYRNQLPAELPADVHHVGYAPFSALMPRLSGLIHHGGIGTSAQALAAAVPQLVVPFAHDQFDNGARLQRLGVARTLEAGASTKAWVASMRPFLEARETTAAVQRYAHRIGDAGAPSFVIATALEALAGRANGDAQAGPVSRSVSTKARNPAV